MPITLKIRLLSGVIIAWLFALTPLVHAAGGPAGSSPHCPPLDPPTGPIVTVDTVAELQTAVNNATAGQTILIADGTYPLNGVYLRLGTPNLTLRGQSGNRDAVILDGNYLTTEIIQIVASNITVADLTLRQAYDHTPSTSCQPPPPTPPAP